MVVPLFSPFNSFMRNIEKWLNLESVCKILRMKELMRTEVHM